MVSPNDRAYLAHAVATLGAASRSLARLSAYPNVAAEVKGLHDQLSEDLKVIRGEEARAREAKQS